MHENDVSSYPRFEHMFSVVWEVLWYWFFWLFLSVVSIISVQGKKGRKDVFRENKVARVGSQSPAVGGVSQEPCRWVLCRGSQPCLQGEWGCLPLGSAPGSSLWLCVWEAEGADKWVVIKTDYFMIPPLPPQILLWPVACALREEDVRGFLLYHVCPALPTC